jgi:electron transport complex protein RnfD
MAMVLLTLVPAAVVYCNFFGWGLVIQFAIAAVAGVLCEAFALSLRRRPLQPALADFSTLVTAALLAFSMPPMAPWWLIVSAMAFAILLAKHLYGGIGMNPFNPAMVGYAVLLISFPAQMTQWLPVSSVAPLQLDFITTLHCILTGHLPASIDVNVLSAATPLAALKSGLALRHTLDEVFATPVFGNLAGAGWEWVSLCVLLGGITMLAFRIIRWHIPVTVLGSVAACSLIMNMFDPGNHPGAMFHLLSGATMLCAFYIATDPVTAPSSPNGRLIYGVCIGTLTYIIRSYGYYHDGVAFAVLTMNLLTPLIDKLTVPRIYGHV